MLDLVNLEVNKSSTNDEIKTAYRKMAMKYHPDRNPGDRESEEKFKEAAEAYDALSNAEKRSRYDQFGHAGVNSSGGFGSGNTGFDINDIFSAFGGGIFDDLFNNQSKQRGGNRADISEPGSDLKIKLPLTLEEIAEGVEKNITIKKMVKCNDCSGKGAPNSKDIVNCKQCSGTGQMKQVSRSIFGQFVNIVSCNNCNGSGKVVINPCKSCNGEGRLQGESVETIGVPAGVSDGNYIPIRNGGNVGRRGGSSGDLIVLIEEKKHEFFVRNGNDVVFDLQISFPQAALGSEIEVPTLKGRSVITIEAGTQNGELLRMATKGIPFLNSNKKGDQIVRINVFVPTKLNDEEKLLLTKLSDFPNIKPIVNNKEKGSFFDKMKEVFS